MKIVPTKSQWKRWSLPAKASYIGVWLGIIGLLSTVAPLALRKPERPVVSILSVDSLLHEDSLETKFVIKNSGSVPAAILVKGEASIGDRTIGSNSEKLATESQSLMPDQIIRYRALTIRGTTYKDILDGKLVPNITQTVTVSYGAAGKDVNDFLVRMKVKLDAKRLADQKNKGLQSLGGLWLLEESQVR